MTKKVSREKDFGVQPERTSLSWRRTLLVIIIHLLILTKLALSSGKTWVFATVILGTISSFICYYNTRNNENEYWDNKSLQYLSSSSIKLILISTLFMLAATYVLFIFLQ